MKDGEGSLSAVNILQNLLGLIEILRFWNHS